jgi:CheY-like chemotaxis protein
VEDTGVGIAGDELDKVFGYFEQTTSGRSRKSGTGLGLAISRDYVRLMGGDITVTSQEGRGSTFRFEILAREGSESDIQETERQQRRVIGLAPGQEIPRILVAEDMADSRTMLMKILETAGFAVKTAANGKEAVEMFHTWRPHFIWMDIRMPVMDGLEATGRIRATEAGKATIIAALTAHALAGEREKILSAGCDEFVAKPFREQEIFEIMAKHLGVIYVYEDRHGKSAAVEPEGEISPEQLATLPVDWRRQLHRAIVELDRKQVLALTEQIKTIDEHIAGELAALAENLAFEPLLDLLGKSEQPEQEDNHDGSSD